MGPRGSGDSSFQNLFAGRPEGLLYYCRQREAECLEAAISIKDIKALCAVLVDVMRLLRRHFLIILAFPMGLTAGTRATTRGNLGFIQTHQCHRVRKQWCSVQSPAHSNMVRGLHKTIRHGSQQDPFEREFEDKLVLGGDMLCLGLYAYTQAIVDFAVKTADLDDVGDPERLLTKGFTGVMAAMDESFFSHPSRTFVVLGCAWLQAGLFTSAFRREHSRQPADFSIMLAIRTWIVCTSLLLGFLGLNHVTITSSDAILVGGLLSVMSVWRFLFATLSPFLP